MKAQKDAPDTQKKFINDAVNEDTTGKKAEETREPAQDTVQDAVKTKAEPALIIKSGATDLRRGAKALCELAANIMEQNVQEGDMYAFANKYKTNVKIVQQTDNGLAQYQKKFNTPIEWADYQEKGTEGYTVKLTGKEKDTFLSTIQCPTHL